MSDTDTAWICPRCGQFTVRPATPECTPTHNCALVGDVVPDAQAFDPSGGFEREETRYLLADSINRIFTDDSVSEIFSGENQLF